MCTCSVEGPTMGQVKTFPLPTGAPFEFNYWNSAMLLHEADHVRECIIKGLKQSPVVSHKAMRVVSEILEEAKKDIGIKYPQDK